MNDPTELLMEKAPSVRSILDIYNQKPFDIRVDEFPDQQKLRATIANMSASQEVVKEALPPERLQQIVC